MDKDTAMLKEGVHVRSFIEAQKGKKILFKRLFSHNKKINALTEVKKNHSLTASGFKSFQKPKLQEIIAQHAWPTLLMLDSE